MANKMHTLVNTPNWKNRMVEALKYMNGKDATRFILEIMPLISIMMNIVSAHAF